jgi:AcrR family transcriptional regulator
MSQAMREAASGRRVRVTRDRALRAAVALADEAGLESLTMRSLARELGVVPMALTSTWRTRMISSRGWWTSSSGRPADLAGRDSQTLVSKERDPRNRRYRSVELTSAGRQAWQRRCATATWTCLPPSPSRSATP